MKEVYFNSATNEIYIDSSCGRTTTIPLPVGLSKSETLEALQSSTVRQLVAIIAEGDR